MTPSEFVELAKVARRVIQESDLSKRKRALLHEIVNYSFARGREWAHFEEQKDLAIITGCHEPDVTNALRELQSEGLLLKRKSYRSLRLRFLPHGALAPAPSKVDPAAAKQIRQKLELLNSFPEGVEPSSGGAGQITLPLAPPADEAVMNELADNSQAEALRISDPLIDQQPAAHGVSKSLTQSVSETLTHNAPQSQFTPRVCTRARDMSHASQKHGHDHVHAPFGARGEEKRIKLEELTEAERDLLQQVEELTGTEGRNNHFRTTWILRIREHPIAVFQAIGETRMAVREGRIRKTIGGTLNWNFELFRDGRPPVAKSTAKA